MKQLVLLRISKQVGEFVVGGWPPTIMNLEATLVTRAMHWPPYDRGELATLWKGGGRPGKCRWQGVRAGTFLLCSVEAPLGGNLLVRAGSLGSRPQFAHNYSVIAIKLLYFSKSQFLIYNTLIISTFFSRALVGCIRNVTFIAEVIFGPLPLGVL